MNVKIFSCSKYNTALINQSCPEIDKHIFYNNTNALSVIYNNILNTHSQDLDCAILCHDDLIIDESSDRLIMKLTKGFDFYDVIGLAGCVSPKIASPCLWHLMGGGIGSSSLRGYVSHPIADKSTHIHCSSFGYTPSRVVMIDGLFIAINIKKIKNIRFDESNPCKFHFYDLDFSLECNKNRLKVGVYPINTIHLSPGLRSYTEDWKIGNEWFLNKWSVAV